MMGIWSWKFEKFIMFHYFWHFLELLIFELFFFCHFRVLRGPHGTHWLFFSKYHISKLQLSEIERSAGYFTQINQKLNFKAIFPFFVIFGYFCHT